MKPDESLFKTHLEEAPFQSGCDAGKWGLLGEIVWPNATIWVRADEQLLPSGKVHLKFTLDGYPANAPTASPWTLSEMKKQGMDCDQKLLANMQKYFDPTGWLARHCTRLVIALPCQGMKLGRNSFLLGGGNRISQSESIWSSSTYV